MFMERWRRLSNVNRWSTHAFIAPLGVAAATYTWANITDTGQWLFWQEWSALTDAFFYGALAYSIFAALLWLSMKCVDSLVSAIYNAGRIEGHAEHQTKAINSGRREGMEIVLSEMWRLAETDNTKSVVRRVANNHDINVPAIVGGISITARVSVVSPWDALWKQMASATAELRQRFGGDEFNDEIDMMLRQAAGVAVSDLWRQIERIRKLKDKRAHI